MKLLFSSLDIWQRFTNFLKSGHILDLTKNSQQTIQLTKIKKYNQIEF